MLHCGMIKFPRLCPDGRAWKLEERGTRCLVPCERVREVRNPDNSITHATCWQGCGRSRSARSVDGSFSRMCPDSLTPRDLLNIIYWFSQRVSQPEDIQAKTQLKLKSTSYVVSVIRIFIGGYHAVKAT